MRTFAWDVVLIFITIDHMTIDDVIGDMCVYDKDDGVNYDIVIAVNDKFCTVLSWWNDGLIKITTEPLGRRWVTVFPLEVVHYFDEFK